MSNEHDNDLIDKLRKEHKNFDLMMFMFISNSVKAKELDNEDAIAFYKGYSIQKKKSGKRAGASLLSLLILILAISIPLYLHINGNLDLSELNDIPAIFAIPIGLILFGLLFYSMIYTFKFLLCWAATRDIRKYYPDLSYNERRRSR